MQTFLSVEITKTKRPNETHSKNNSRAARLQTTAAARSTQPSTQRAMSCGNYSLFSFFPFRRKYVCGRNRLSAFCLIDIRTAQLTAPLEGASQTACCFGGRGLPSLLAQLLAGAWLEGPLLASTPGRWVWGAGALLSSLDFIRLHYFLFSVSSSQGGLKPSVPSVM